jgi:hypothetical protein
LARAAKEISSAGASSMRSTRAIGLLPLSCRAGQGAAAPPVQVEVVDATDVAALRASLQDAWGVVSCVTSSSGAITRGAHALFAAAQDLPISPRIVYVSSQSIYGEACGDVMNQRHGLGR